VRLVAVLPLVAYAVVTIVVGVRLLRLSARTRQLPEFALGLGLLLASGVGQGLSALGRAPAWIGTTPGDAIFSIGVLVSHTGLALIVLFTWSVFRRRSRLALAALVAITAALAVAAAGLIAVGTGVGDIREALPRTRPWAVLSLTLTTLAFLWSAAESLRYERMLRRRLALGLADPVVADRFRLWTIVGVANAAFCMALVICLQLGLSPMTEPVPMTIDALMGTVASVAWYLSFLPPERYLARVRRRAAMGTA